MHSTTTQLSITHPPLDSARKQLFIQVTTSVDFYRGTLIRDHQGSKFLIVCLHACLVFCSPPFGDGGILYISIHVSIKHIHISPTPFPSAPPPSLAFSSRSGRCCRSLISGSGLPLLHYAVLFSFPVSLTLISPIIESCRWTSPAVGIYIHHPPASVVFSAR